MRTFYADETSPIYLGTHKVVLKTNSKDICRGNILKILNPKNNKICGAIVCEIQKGNERIEMCKYLRENIDVKLGDIVHVNVIKPKDAETVYLNVLENFPQETAAVDMVKKQLIGKPISVGNIEPIIILNDKKFVQVTKTIPSSDIVIVTELTQFDIKVGKIKKDIGKVITYGDIGGLDNEINRIREIVEYPLNHPEVYQHLGIKPPKGILLYGPPGTGKTLLVKALANELKANFFIIEGPEIMDKFFGEPEKKLREKFSEAQKNAPSIILIDEIDSIVPKREESHSIGQSIVATMLSLMDGITELEKVVVIGTTNRIDFIDPALRRPGRFEEEIYVGVPDGKGRKKILQIHTSNIPLSNDVNFDKIVDMTHGFVGADISSLCTEAARNALKRTFSKEQLESGSLPIEEISKLKISQCDFDKALTKIKPSAMREVIVEIPKVSWKDIGGLEDVKKALTENIIYAIKKPESFEKVGIKPPRGILLYGPPGTGKTLLAKAVANECGANFISVKGPEIFSKFVGESEGNIRFLFSKAREVSPCVLFFDEIDAIAPARGTGIAHSITDSIVNQMLAEMDGIESLENVFVMAATNRLDIVDPALLRPGRFDYLIEVPLPDENARKEIFKIYLNKMSLEDMDIDSLTTNLARMTEGYSGSHIMSICREAGLYALRSYDFDLKKVKVGIEHFQKAYEKFVSDKKKIQEYRKPPTDVAFR